MNIDLNARSSITAAVVACVAATLLVSGEANASAEETLTFRGVTKERDLATLDVKPAGDSLGDRSVASMTLRQGGAIAGRLEGICTTVDNTYEGHMCTLVVILKDGRLAFEGAGTGKSVPNVGGKGDEFALTGGTGRYVGANGTLSVAQDDKGDRITIVLK